jgi:hypothetical protein
METMKKTPSDAEPVTTLASLAPILKLDKLQIKSVLRSYNYTDDPSPLPRYVTLHLLLADILERLAFLKPSQRQAIADAYDAEIAANMPQWQTLAFADGNWCTWTGRTGWLDLTSGDTIDVLPAPPVETIGYNLVVLYDRAIAQIQKRAQHAQEHPAGSPDEPGDVC